MRVIEVIKRYAELYGTVPENIATGFAAYLFFMKPVKKDGNIYYGELNGNNYPINDNKAELYHTLWQEQSPSILVNTVVNNASLWDTDFATIPGFADKVTEKLRDIMQHGMLSVLQQQKIKTNQEV